MTTVTITKNVTATTNSAISCSISLREQMELLIAYGKATGLDVSIEKLSDATGESLVSIWRLLSGEDADPNAEMLMNIVHYFGISLAYFECRSAAECQEFLERVMSHGATQPGQGHSSLLAQQAKGVSGSSREFILKAIHWVRQAEDLRR